MWCRAEQLCHILRNTTAQIWLTTAESCERMQNFFEEGKEEEWIQETIRVFKGECTEAIDKISLVAPILGLYAELYACRDLADERPDLVNFLDVIEQHKEEVFPRSFAPGEWQRRPVARRERSKSSGSPSPASRLPPALYMSSSEGFASIQRTGGPSPAGSAADADSFSRQETNRLRSSFLTFGSPLSRLRLVSEGRYDLFGNLVAAVEQVIDEDEQLRQSLIKAVRRRRGDKRRKTLRLSRRPVNTSVLGGLFDRGRQRRRSSAGLDSSAPGSTQNRRASATGSFGAMLKLSAKKLVSVSLPNTPDPNHAVSLGGFGAPRVARRMSEDSSTSSRFRMRRLSDGLGKIIGKQTRSNSVPTRSPEHTAAVNAAAAQFDGIESLEEKVSASEVC